jgi:hypothetical protein
MLQFGHRWHICGHWFGTLLRRPVVRHEWLRSSEVYAHRWLFADSGQPLCEGRIRTGDLGPPDRIVAVRGETAISGEGFRMAIEKVIHLSERPGLYLAGKISSGTVRTGDRLNLLGGETVIREVICDGVEIVDVDIHRPELALVAVHVRSLRRGHASEGWTLASVPDGE